MFKLLISLFLGFVLVSQTLLANDSTLSEPLNSTPLSRAQNLLTQRESLQSYDYYLSECRNSTFKKGASYELSRLQNAKRFFSIDLMNIDEFLAVSRAIKFEKGYTSKFYQRLQSHDYIRAIDKCFEGNSKLISSYITWQKVSESLGRNAGIAETIGYNILFPLAVIKAFHWGIIKGINKSGQLTGKDSVARLNRRRFKKIFRRSLYGLAIVGAVSFAQYSYKWYKAANDPSTPINNVFGTHLDRLRFITKAYALDIANMERVLKNPPKSMTQQQINKREAELVIYKKQLRLFKLQVQKEKSKQSFF